MIGPMSMWPALAVSLLAHPLHLGPEPPEVRTARYVQIAYSAAEEGASSSRTLTDALALARTVVTRARAGEDLAVLAARYSSGWNARAGAVLGSFTPGALEPPLDAFLFSAEVGEVSEPLVTPRGVLVLERVETWVGVRHILVAGHDEAARARACELLAVVRAGKAFAEIARAESDDAETAARGGALAIYERGPRDRLLKRLAFDLDVGEVGGPIETPCGFHLLQRVPPEDLDPGLREATFVRARGLLVSWEGAPAAPKGVTRDGPTAKRLVEALHERIAAGESFAALASQVNDDPGGRERGGDLGWLHRQDPGLAPALAEAFRLRPGALCDAPIPTPAGYLLLLRER